MKALPFCLTHCTVGFPIALIVFSSSVFGAPITWDNSGGTSLWTSVPAVPSPNWDTDTEPTSADDVIFPFGLAGTITTTTTENALSLTFNDAYSLSGGTLALASGNSITVATGVTATIGNALNITSGTTKLGDGILELNASNTNTTGTLIAAGTLRVGNAGALGSAASVTTVSDGTFLQVKSGITLDRSISLLHGGTVASVGGSAINNGKITIDAGATAVTLATDGASDVFTVGNAANELTGGSSFTVVSLSGPGSVRLGAASDFDGSWNLPSGVLELATATSLGDQNTSGITLSGGVLSARPSSNTNFATSSPGNNIIVTADSGLRSDRTIATVALTHTFGALSIGTNTLNVAPGPNATSGTAGIVLGDVTLSGNPVFAVDDSGVTNGKLTTGSLLGGGLARSIIKSGAGDFAASGGSTDLPSGSAFTASGGGIIEMIFPALGATTPVAVSAAETPFGEASISITDGGLNLLANGSGNSTAQLYQIASAISLGGTVTLDANRISGSSSNKTFQLPGLTLAADTVLSMAGDFTHGVALAGPLALQGGATLKGIDISGKDGLLTLGGGISGGAVDELTIDGGTSLLNLTINAASTYGGGTTMNASNVTLGATGAFGTGPTVLNGGSLIVNADGALGGSVTLNGGTLRANGNNALASNSVVLGGGTLDLRNNTTSTMNLAALTVSGTSSLNIGNNGSGSSQTFEFPVLNVSGNTTLTTSPLNSFVPNFQSIVLAGNLTFNQTGTARIQSITEDASPRTLIKTGTGTLEMEAAGNYSGGTELLQGILLVQHSDALGTGALTIGDTSGTTAPIARFDPGLTIENIIVARAGGTGTLTLDASAGNVIWNGDVDLQRTLTLDNGSGSLAATLNGTLSGVGDLLKVGGGEMVLTNAMNSFGSGAVDSVGITTGTITVASDGALGNAANGVNLTSSGILRITGSFATSRTITVTGTATDVNVTSGNTLTVNSPFAGTGTFTKGDTGTLEIGPAVDATASRGSAITALGAGVLRLQGAKNLSDAGPFTLGAATLELLSDANTDFAHPLTANSASTIFVDRASGGSATNGRHTLGALTTTAGNLTITGDHGYGLSLGDFTTTSNNTLTNNAPGALELASLNGNPANSIRTMNVGGSGDIHILGDTITGAGTGAYRLTKTGEGTFRFGTSVSGFGNITTISNGTLDLNGLNYLSDDLNLGGGASVSGAQIVTGAGSLQLLTGLTFTTASPAPEGATITGTVDLGNLVQSFVVNDSTGAVADVTVDGSIIGTAGAGVTKSGAGTLRFTGTGNTYPGLTTITAGLLELDKSSGNGIGAGGLTNNNATVSLLAAEQFDNSAPVLLSGLNDTLLELNNFTETLGPVTLEQTDAFDYSAIRTGATGTLVLAADMVLSNNTNSSFSDARNILITGTGTDAIATTDGTLDLGGAVRTIQVTTTTVGTNETKANATIETQIINGGIIKTGPRTLYLTHPNNTFAGGLQIAEGTVVPTTLGSLGTGPVTFTNTGASSSAIELGGLTGTNSDDFTIGGSGSGSTTLIYSAPAPEMLVLSGNFDLERSLSVNVVNGGINSGTSAILDITGPIDDGAFTAGLVKLGNGMLKLASGNTFSGGTTIEAGILSIPADSALGDSTVPLTIDGGCLQPTASLTMTRDLIFGSAGGSVRVDAPSVLEFPGDVAWGSGTVGFFGVGTTVFSGTSSGTGGDLWLGKPTAFATGSFTETAAFGHVLSLRGTTALPDGNLSITHNSVLELGSGDFTRPLGTGPGEVQLPTNYGGGWAAHGADRSVNLGGAGDTLVWGQISPAFLYSSGYGSLILGSSTATHTIDFENPIQLNNGATSMTRKITVPDGPAALDARVSGGVDQSANPATTSTRLQLDVAGTLEINSPLSGEIYIDKMGTGTAIISGTNSRTGGINVEAGTLVIASDASWNPPPVIYVDAGAELDASALTGPIGLDPNFPSVLIDGTITGDLVTDAYLDGIGVIDGDYTALADSYIYPSYGGVLHVTGDYTHEVGAYLNFYIDGLVPQVDFSQMRVGGAVNLSGDINLGASWTLLEGDSVVLILHDGTDPINGTFNNLPEGAVIPIGNGLALQVTYIGGDGNDFAATVVEDTFSSDLNLSANSCSAVDLGADILVSYEIHSPGPAAVSDAVLDVTLPLNATLATPLEPGWSITSGILSIPLPPLAVPDTVTINLHFTAPLFTTAVVVDAYVYSSADSFDFDNYYTTTTAVMPGGNPVITGFTRNETTGNLEFGIDTIDGIIYVLESSTDLGETGWQIEEYIYGDDLPYMTGQPTDDPSERNFFRFRIIPNNGVGGGGGVE